MRGAKRKYPIGQEPWTLAGISEKKWRRRDLESRLSPTQLAARRAHIRVTLKAAAKRRLAAGHPSVRRSVARPSRRVKNAIPLPGVSVYDNWHGRGAALKGIKRPPRGLSRVAWGAGRSARRSMALRAALEAGKWAAAMTRDPEFGQQRGDHDATLEDVAEKQVA